MDKKYINALESRVLRLNELLALALQSKNREFTALQVKEVLGCNLPNTSKFLKEFRAYILQRREGHKVIYFFKEELIFNWDPKSYAEKVLLETGKTYKHVSKDPAKKTQQDLEKELADLKEENEQLKKKLKKFNKLCNLLKEVLQ